MPAATERKSAVLALLLSLWMPGVGQFYVGQVGKGIMFLILALVAWMMILSVVGILLGIPMLIIVAIWAAVDGYKAVNG